MSATRADHSNGTPDWHQRVRSGFNEVLRTAPLGSIICGRQHVPQRDLKGWPWPVERKKMNVEKR